MFYFYRKAEQKNASSTVGNYYLYLIQDLHEKILSSFYFSEENNQTQKDSSYQGTNQNVLVDNKMGISEIVSVDPVDEMTPWNEIQFPLSNTDDLTYLDHLLGNNAEFRREFVEIFTNINFLPNSRTRFDFAFAVADKIFDRELLVKYSWTGHSINPIIKKLPFKTYTEILRAFYEILSTRNKKYSRAVTLYFLKNVMFRRVCVNTKRYVGFKK